MILARHTLKVRTTINSLYPDDLFRDSAWDMMLELFVARMEGKQLCVKDLVVISGESPTSALRRIDRLQTEGLIQRRLDRRDHRRLRVDLTEAGHTAMVLMLEHLYNLDEHGQPQAKPAKSFTPHQKD